MVQPIVTTQAVANITDLTATGNGNITNLGVPNPTAHGMVWNTTGTPTVADNFTDEGAAGATGPFTSAMTGLLPGTLYYVRAYATNTTGTAYGNEVTFTTLNIPTITTQAVTAITDTTATGNGTIIDLGVPNPTAYGVVWSTALNPTTADNVSDLGAAGSTGSFTAPITGLTTSTLYHVRAFATNTVGTVYGADVIFTTSTAPTVTVNQAGAQADPTNVTPINFDVVFSEAINPATFTAADITQNGTSTGITWTITNSGDNINFTLAATVVATNGTVVPSISIGTFADAGGNTNTAASTSTDNSVTYNSTAPTVTVNQAGAQADPTNATPINFDVVFSEAINPATFTAADITQNGTSTGITWTITNSGDNINFTLAATVVTTNGTVVPSISIGTFADAGGNTNTAASTSTDNSVTYDLTAPTVTVNQAGAQADPTNVTPINFDVVFSGGDQSSHLHGGGHHSEWNIHRHHVDHYQLR